MVMSSPEIKITKCPPGYAWGYTPTGSKEVVDNIDKDFCGVINAFNQTTSYIAKSRFFHGTK